MCSRLKRKYVSEALLIFRSHGAPYGESGWLVTVGGRLQVRRGRAALRAARTATAAPRTRRDPPSSPSSPRASPNGTWSPHPHPHPHSHSLPAINQPCCIYPPDIFPTDIHNQLPSEKYDLRVCQINKKNDISRIFKFSSVKKKEKSVTCGHWL